MDDEVDLEDEIDDRCTVLWDENNDRWEFYCWLRGRLIFSLEFRRRFVFLSGIFETLCFSREVSFNGEKILANERENILATTVEVCCCIARILRVPLVST